MLRGAVRRQIDPREDEFRRRCGVHEFATARAFFRFQYRNVDGVEVEDAQQLRNVHVLGRESPAQHVVGVGHDLDGHPVQVGVEVARVEVQALPWFEGDPVQEERGQHPRIPWVHLTQFEGGADLRRELTVLGVRQIGDASVEHSRHQRAEHRLRQRDPCGEQRAETVRVGLPGDQAGVGLQLRNRNRLEQFDRPLRVPETGERVEPAEATTSSGLWLASL